MKKGTLPISLLCIGLMTGCVDQDKYDALEKENQALKAKLSQLEPRKQDTAAYAIAAQSAGKELSPADWSIAQASKLLEITSSQYHVTPERMAAMVLKCSSLMAEKKILATPLEILDGASVFGAVDARQWDYSPDTVGQFCGFYAISRDSGLTHEQAVEATISTQSTIINTLHGKHLP